MEVTAAQYRLIEGCLPTRRGNVSFSNLQVLNAILYVAEQGCKWRGLPKRFGNWHTIYTRMNCWSKSGVLDRVFAKLQHAQIVRVRVEAVALDSNIVKVHPTVPRRQKKRRQGDRQVPRRMDHQDSSGCRGCSNGHNVRLVAGPGRRCSRGTQAAAATWPGCVADPSAHGPRLLNSSQVKPRQVELRHALQEVG